MEERGRERVALAKRRERDAEWKKGEGGLGTVVEREREIDDLMVATHQQL